MIRDGRSPAAARQAAQRLVLFTGVLADPAGQAFLRLMELLDQSRGGWTSSEPVWEAYGSLFRLLAADVELGTQAPVGDPWQNHLLERLLGDENPFSRKAAVAGLAAMGPSLVEQAREDLRGLEQLAAWDAAAVCDAVAAVTGVRPAGWANLRPRPATDGDDPLAAAREAIKRRLAQAADWGEALPDLAAHFRTHGTGMFGRYRAFRWDGDTLVPVLHADPVRLAQLPGYTRHHQRLLANTRRFVRGLPAHNALLYGPAGTGKSSAVKAVVNELAGEGLRLVEVGRDGIAELPKALAVLADRGNPFILFIDDLSFEDHETEYKSLKACLEGSAAARPANVLVYATSNRRHLVRQRVGERPGAATDELHPQDAMAEKLSLVERFGLRIAFYPPDQAAYLEMVETLVRQAGLEVDRDELHRRALAFEREQGGRSGRTARRFVDELVAEAAGGPDR
ncbi:MAG TPA: ATP-binding protein [Limnochordales bacterium]